MSNRPKLADLAQWTPQQVAALSAEELQMLQEDLAAEESRVKGAKARLAGGLELRYAERAAAARRAEGKDTGTVRVSDGDCVVVADLGKKVEWNQAQLRELHAKIAASGDDPAQYIKTEYGVSEAAFNAWPENIRAAFAPARTVRTGKPTFRIEPAKREAA